MNNKITNVIYFTSLRTVALFKMELEGQISDGKYENSRPFDHWKWLWNNEVRMSDESHKPGYYTTRYWEPRLKAYNLDEWPCWIANKKGKYNDYTWARRVLAYGRFAKALESINFTDLNLFISQTGSLETLIESMMYFLEVNENGTYDEFFKYVESNSAWRISYFEKATILNETTFELFKNTSYDLKELRSDIKTLKSDVNTINRVNEL